MTDTTWNFISGCLLDLQRQSDRLDRATDGLMIAPESPLLDCQARTAETIIAALEYLAGDDWNNISWYVYENDYGRKGYAAGVDDDMRVIDDHDKLRWLIELQQPAQESNQCDGCKRGLPVVDGLHRAADGTVVMACTAWRYRD